MGFVDLFVASLRVLMKLQLPVEQYLQALSPAEKAVTLNPRPIAKSVYQTEDKSTCPSRDPAAARGVPQPPSSNIIIKQNRLSLVSVSTEEAFESRCKRQSSGSNMLKFNGGVQWGSRKGERRRASERPGVSCHGERC